MNFIKRKPFILSPLHEKLLTFKSMEQDGHQSFKALILILFFGFILGINGCANNKIKSEQTIQKTKTFTSNVKYDKFEKHTKVSTKLDGRNKLLRTIVQDNGEVGNIQLYISFASFDGWSHLDKAIDSNGNQHKVTKIDAKADCSFLKDLGKCMQSETVAVNFDYEYLLKNKNGFEIKVFGKREYVDKVSNEHIEKFLHQIDLVKQSLK